MDLHRRCQQREGRIAQRTEVGLEHSVEAAEAVDAAAAATGGDQVVAGAANEGVVVKAAVERDSAATAAGDDGAAAHLARAAHHRHAGADELERSRRARTVSCLHQEAATARAGIDEHDALSIVRDARRQFAVAVVQRKQYVVEGTGLRQVDVQPGAVGQGHQQVAADVADDIADQFRARAGAVALHGRATGRGSRALAQDAQCRGGTRAVERTHLKLLNALHAVDQLQRRGLGVEAHHEQAVKPGRGTDFGHDMAQRGVAGIEVDGELGRAVGAHDLEIGACHKRHAVAVVQPGQQRRRRPARRGGKCQVVVIGGAQAVRAQYVQVDLGPAIQRHAAGNAAAGDDTACRRDVETKFDHQHRSRQDGRRRLAGWRIDDVADAQPGACGVDAGRQLAVRGIDRGDDIADSERRRQIDLNAGAIDERDRQVVGPHIDAARVVQLRQGRVAGQAQSGEGRGIQRVARRAASQRRHLYAAERVDTACGRGQREVGQGEVGILLLAQGVDAHVALQGVVAAAAGQDVVAGAADQDVGIAVAEEAVVAGRADDVEEASNELELGGGAISQVHQHRRVAVVEAVVDGMPGASSDQNVFDVLREQAVGRVGTCAVDDAEVAVCVVLDGQGQRGGDTAAEAQQIAAFA